MNRTIVRVATLLPVLLLAWGCGGEGASSDGASEGAGQAQPSAQEEPALSKDAPVDPELASRGETLFRDKGCVACHSLGGGRLVGPDLLGVTERRELTWIRSMILNPDSMLQNDPTAKELLGQYYTPMTNMQVEPEHARALIHFLRRETEAAASSPGS